MNHGVNLATGQFDGRGSYLEVPARPALDPRTGDFSISSWVYTEASRPRYARRCRVEIRSGSAARFHALAVLDFRVATTARGATGMSRSASTTPGPVSGRTAAGRVPRAAT